MSTTEISHQFALDLCLAGRYSLANRRDTQGNRREFACRTSRISPFHMKVDVPVSGIVGDRVISYFGEFGKLDGWITDTFNGGFLFELAITKARRETLSNKMVWLEKQKKDPAVHDARGQGRIVPENPHSKLTFADGSALGCFVIDMSASGAAVSADVLPDLGTPLAVGRCVGRVVRHFREGFALKFVQEQDFNRLEELVILP